MCATIPLQPIRATPFWLYPATLFFSDASDGPKIVNHSHRSSSSSNSGGGGALLPLAAGGVGEAEEQKHLLLQHMEKNLRDDIRHKETRRLSFLFCKPYLQLGLEDLKQALIGSLDMLSCGFARRNYTLTWNSFLPLILCPALSVFVRQLTSDGGRIHRICLISVVSKFRHALLDRKLLLLLFDAVDERWASYKMQLRRHRGYQVAERPTLASCLPAKTPCSNEITCVRHSMPYTVWLAQTQIINLLPTLNKTLIN